MKSITKFCLILASVFAILGVAGIVAGMCLGARPSQFLGLVRNNGRISWHNHHLDLWNDWDALDDRTDDLDDWTDDVSDWQDDFNDWQEEMDEWGNLPAIDEIEEASGENVDIQEGSFGGAYIERLKLDLDRSSVKIYAHEGEDFQIVAKNTKNYFKIKESGDTLLIEDHRGMRRKNALILELYLPKRSLEKIEMDLGASILYVEALQAEKLEIDLGSSEARIDSIETQKTEMEVGAGELQLRSLSAGEKAILGVGTGNMEVESFTGGDLDLECGIGNLEIRVQGRESDYNYSMSCGIGNISLNGSDYSGLGREKQLNNSAGKDIIMECGIGEISLEFTE